MGIFDRLRNKIVEFNPKEQAKNKPKKDASAYLRSINYQPFRFHDRVT
jgi:hypothetical protein